MNYKTKLKEIDTLVFDVDGVFTDNTLYIMEGQEPMRKMNVKDGYAIQLAVKKGYRIAIITGGRSEAVAARFKGLGVNDVYLNSHDKLKVFKDFCKTHNVNPTNVLYMGDDIPDIPVMMNVGLACCPQDASEGVKAISSYISPVKGGLGCVREVLEQLLRLNGHWQADEDHIW
jgi:3-deoxy-D-manno-octulosonate 8-phosphate phosphatase (KDO 8-P phosphatase)